MKLKRYTNQELQELLPQVFLDYMIEKGVEEVHESYRNKIDSYRSTINLYESSLKNGTLEDSTITSIKEQLNYLYEGIKHLELSNMKYQKELYEQTHSMDFSRSVIKFPLNKRINSFYDDLYLEVVFFDDVCTPMGKYQIYKSLESDENQKEFLMRYIEITNIGLVYERNNRRVAILEVIGSLNYDDERAQKSGVELLNKKFSDFENLTLSDTSQIVNNDIKQWIQTKIDLDKENMKELAKVFIRGDYYSIHKPQNENDLYIRYICRSTGRVYYNKLNLENLKISKYFNKDDYESYAKAWWNLTHLGSKPEGKPVIAC